MAVSTQLPKSQREHEMEKGDRNLELWCDLGLSFSRLVDNSDLNMSIEMRKAREEKWREAKAISIENEEQREAV